MGEAMSKGNGYLTSKQVWTELLAPEELQKIVAALSPPSRALWDHPPLAVAWLPRQHTIEFAIRAHEQLGERALSLAHEAARRMVHKDFTGIYRALIRLATVDYVLSKAMKYYDQYTRDSGTSSPSEPDRRAPSTDTKGSLTRPRSTAGSSAAPASASSSSSARAKRRPRHPRARRRERSAGDPPLAAAGWRD